MQKSQLLQKPMKLFTTQEINDLLKHMSPTYFGIEGRKNSIYKASFMAVFEKDENQQKFCLNFPEKHTKIE